MEKLILIVFGVFIVLNIIFKKQITEILNFLFAKKQILIHGEIVKIEEKEKEIPLFLNSFDNFYILQPETSINVKIYTIEVKMSGENYLIKISHELYQELKDKFEKGVNSFSKTCLKSNWEEYFQVA